MNLSGRVPTTSISDLPRSPQNARNLIRQLGLFDSTMLMVGIVLGSGIFITTGIMAQHLPSVWLILAAWMVGGVLTLAGAFAFAELGAAIPEAGGPYVYLRKAYGPLVGFLFGWVTFAVYLTGAIAGLGVAFAEYMGYFLPDLSTQAVVFRANLFGIEYVLSPGQLVAVGVILLLSLVNYVGVSFGKTVQNFLTVVKIGSILALVFFGLAIGKGAFPVLDLNPEHLGAADLLTGFGLALVAVGWAYDGWNNVTYVAGEIENPSRNLPASLFLGTLTVTILYILVNLIYFYALPLNEIAGVVRVAEKAAMAMFGETGAAVISAAVLVSVLGALSGTILVGPRVYFAMARDNLFFQKAGQIDSRFHTPGFAIILQAVWASLLALSGTLEQLLTFVVFVSILFGIAGTAALFTLRRKLPNLPRPYKAWGYPIVPMVFIFASAGILVNTLVQRPVEALAGLLLMAIGIPVYYFWKRHTPPERV